MNLHPSGLTWERWNFPFKTAAERQIVIKYLNPDLIFDDSIPF